MHSLSPSAIRHGLVEFLEAELHALLGLHALVPAASDAAVFSRGDALGCKVVDAVVEALVNHARVHLGIRVRRSRRQANEEVTYAHKILHLSLLHAALQLHLLLLVEAAFPVNKIAQKPSTGPRTLP